MPCLKRTRPRGGQQLHSGAAPTCTSIWLSWGDNLDGQKTNKYISADIQNERLQVMAMHILRQVGSSIRKKGTYTVPADKCTDVSNKEQYFTACIRWVDETLTDHEYVIGLRHVELIDANCLVDAIKDVLLWINLRTTIFRHWGQGGGGRKGDPPTSSSPGPTPVTFRPTNA